MMMNTESKMYRIAKITAQGQRLVVAYNGKPYSYATRDQAENEAAGRKILYGGEYKVVEA